MKIYKVKLDPSNPIEKLIKVPVGSDYGIQINWDYGKYPKFINTDIDTENGFLTNYAGKWEENKSFHEIEGQKIFTGLPILTNIGEIVTFYYGKDETFNENELNGGLGSVKVVGIDTDDYDVHLGESDWVAALTLEAGNYIDINNNLINGPTVTIGCTDSICGVATFNNMNWNIELSSKEIPGIEIGTLNNLSGDISLNDNTWTLNLSADIPKDGFLDGIYNDPVILTNGTITLNKLKTVYKSSPTSTTNYSIIVPSGSTGKIITFWLWVVMGGTVQTVKFPSNVSFIDLPPTLNINSETMFALMSTDGGTTWIANTQWQIQK